MSKFLILPGSVTGTALATASAVSDTLISLGHECRINSEADIQDLTQDPQEILLVVTATTGQGDLPPEIFPLHLQLSGAGKVISQRQYGVIGLGDSSYMNFCQAAIDMDSALSHCGGVRLGQPLLIDALMTNDHESDASEWVSIWVQQL